MCMEMNDRDWQFVEGAWTPDRDGIITAPENLGDQNLAIYTARAWGDFEARFEFCRDTVWTNEVYIWNQ